MTDEELPSWLNRDFDAEEEEEESIEYGRGARVRKDVLYDDGLSEKKFLKALNSDNPEQALQMAQSKQRKRKEQKGYVEDIEPEAPVATKRRSTTLSSPPVVATPGRPPKRPREVKALPHIQALNKKLRVVWDKVNSITEEGTGRVISKLFQRLPSKKDYADYYVVIQNPIDLKKILSKIEKCLYKTRQEFEVCSAYFDYRFTLTNYHAL